MSHWEVTLAGSGEIKCSCVGEVCSVEVDDEPIQIPTQSSSSAAGTQICNSSTVDALIDQGCSLFFFFLVSRMFLKLHFQLRSLSSLSPFYIFRSLSPLLVKRGLFWL